MRKLLAEPRPIEVRLEAGRPAALRLNGRWRQVKVLDYWRETGRWWDSEPEREFLRLQAGGILVVGRAREGPDRRWLLYAIED